MVDLFCGLGGATEGFLAEGWDCIGVDIEQHIYGQNCYPAQLWVQDILTISGSQLRNADFIWASPPCQAYSWMAMPWSRAKAKAEAIRADTTGAELERLNRLFNTCFRIQREACEAAGRHIPMVVENVRGAIPWVGRSRWNHGSFHIWGDVPALMPVTLGRSVMKRGVAHRGDGVTNFHGQKVPGFRFDGSGRSFQSASVAKTDGRKQPGIDLSAVGFNVANAQEFGSMVEGVKIVRSERDKRAHIGTKRKFASAMIAKIPEPLSRHIARVYHP